MKSIPIGLEPVSAMGYLAHMLGDFNEATPALIVNPQARPLDLLAWCYGEVVSLDTLLEVLGCAGADMNHGDLAALFTHRITPLAKVLEVAISALVAANSNRPNKG